MDLRLIGFEAAQSSSRRCRLGNPVAAANTFKLALSDDLHRHADFPIIRSFCRAAKTGAGTTVILSNIPAFFELNITRPIRNDSKR